MDGKRSKLYASFFLMSLDQTSDIRKNDKDYCYNFFQTTSQLYKSMKLLEKEFERTER